MWFIKLLFTATVVSATSNMIFKKIDVQVGTVGSDDDIRIKICDRAKCCTTKELSHTFGSEWTKNKLETWDGRKLGNCSKILFDDKLSSVEVSIVKELKRKDPLEVTSITLSAQVGSDKKNLQMFKCRSYSFRATDSLKSNNCLNEKTSPKSVSSTTRRTSVAGVPTKKTVASSSSSGLPILLVKKIIVQVGAVGTNEDVSMKICDLQKCCVTNELSNRLSSEWVKNKLETWEGRKLGNCSSILFQSGAPSLDVTVLKTIKKKQPLDITSIVLEASPAKDKKNIEKFKCSSYKFLGTDKEKKNRCLNDKPSTITSLANMENYKVNNVVVQMGNDGTNDDVSLEICSSKSALNCCDTGKLSSTLSDDWSKNDKETWKNKDLGPCKTKSWDPCKGFDVAVKKKSGKDSLKVNTITLDLADKNNAKQTQKFVCSNYNVGATDTVKRSSCTLDKSSQLSCPKTPSVTTTRSITSLADLENYKVNNVVVEMGNDGTKDDVSLEICNSKSALTCCDTGKLDAKFSNDWSRNGKDTWKNKDLGPCQTKTWDACRGFDVAVKKKSGKDSLKVNTITLDLADKNNAKQTQKFVCSNYNVGATDTVKRSTCTLDKSSKLNCPKPSSTATKRPWSSLPGQSLLVDGTENVSLKGFEVEVGIDGTADTVTAKVCNLEQNICCETPPLNKFTSTNDWARNGKTTWPGMFLGKCQDKMIPTIRKTTVTNLLETKLLVTLTKTGSSDGLKLDNFYIDADTVIGTQKRRFKCGKIQVVGTNTATTECYAQFPKQMTVTPRPGPCLRSGKNCDTATTTRPPFRSVNGK